MQLACEHCGRLYDSNVPRSGGLERCTSCSKLNLYLPDPESSFIIFGDYKIEDRLGTGGNALVVRGRHLATGDDYALKLFYTSPGDDEHGGKEFTAEVEMASQLVHDNIVRIFGGGEIDGVLHIVMELIDGMNLAEYLESYGPMPAEDAIAVGAHVCYALDHVWSNFLMIHRDVKPHNIMITSDGCVKLCDFGLVSSHETAVTDSKTIIGTPYYVSPEMVTSDGHQDNRADVYSLGTSLFHIISGSPPFNYGSLLEVLNARLRDNTSRLDEVMRNCPAGLADVLATMMALNPDDRYVTATEAAEDLLRIRDGHAPLLVDAHRSRRNQ